MWVALQARIKTALETRMDLSQLCRRVNPDSLVPVNRLHRERRQTDSNIFRASLGRSGILDPLPTMRNHGLTRHHVHLTILVPHSHHALEYQSKFVELRSLSRFLPSLRAAHVGYADARTVRVHSSNLFVDQLGFASRGGYASGLRYQGRHECSFEKNYCSKSTHK